MMFATDQASNYASNNRRVVDLVKTNDMDEPYSDFRDYPEEDDYSKQSNGWLYKETIWAE